MAEAFAPVPGADPHLPSFLDPFPTAVINYRWAGSSPLTSPFSEPSTTQEEFKAPLHWPTPLHDILYAYTWITENLRPENNTRRAIYLHGTYLGATLAAALALTESHKHEPMAVRGFAAYNGIYNWTMFLPDHKLNKPTTYRGKTTPVPPPDEGSALRDLRDAMPTLFGAPVQLLDPFASPALLFQTAGMEIPPSFTQTAAVAGLVDRMAALGLEGSAADLMPASVGKAPRRSALMFPPRKSTLGIPTTLLVHDGAVAAGAGAVSAPGKRKTTSVRKRKAKGNQFEAQAEELAGLMRRSMEKLELKERMKWDEEYDAEGEMEARVRVVDVGEGGEEELSERGEAVVREWLEERMAP
ncbi:hypothetical protein ACHAQA_003090 [Verticillium albo-atrum]